MLVVSRLLNFSKMPVKKPVAAVGKKSLGVEVKHSQGDNPVLPSCSKVASAGSPTLTVIVRKVPEKLSLPKLLKKVRVSGEGSSKAAPSPSPSKAKVIQSSPAPPTTKGHEKKTSTSVKGPENLLSPKPNKSKDKQTTPSHSKKMNLSISGGDMTKISPAREIQSLVECPICTCVPLGPIFNCASGHIICGDCREKTRQCGLCRAQITNSRNFVAEKIVASSRIACEYREHGCTFISAGDKLLSHLASCNFGPFPCVYGRYDGCNSSVVPKSNYVAHLADVHKVKKMHQVDGIFKKSYRLTCPYSPDVDWPGSLALFNGKSFITCSFGKNDNFHFSLCILDSEVDTDKYKVRMLFKKPNTTDKEPFLDITVPVVSIRCTEKDIAGSMHCYISKTMLCSSAHQEKITDGRKQTFNWEVYYQILQN